MELETIEVEMLVELHPLGLICLRMEEILEMVLLELEGMVVLVEEAVRKEEEDINLEAVGEVVMEVMADLGEVVVEDQ